MSREIPLTRGFVALVDDEDFDRLSQLRWQFNTHKKLTTGYAVTGKPQRKMHHFILPPRPGFVIDHINRNGCDNRRSNLRYATESQNAANRIRRNVSGFRGVYPRPACPNSYVAIITERGRRNQLGVFSDKVVAALAYDEAARQLFGEFAVLNFPDKAA